MISEIEVQVITPDADYTNDTGTHNQVQMYSEQIYADNIEKSNTFHQAYYKRMIAR